MKNASKIFYSPTMCDSYYKIISYFVEIVEKHEHRSLIYQYLAYLYAM